MNKLLQLYRQHFLVDPHTKRFIAFNKKKWKRRQATKSVVLIDMYPQPTYSTIFISLGNLIADITGAKVRSFYFALGFGGRLGLGRRRVKNVYRSAGAPLGLSFKDAWKYWFAADQFAKKTFENLKSSWDILDITVEGVKIGPPIYQSFLRNDRETMDLRHPELFRLIRDGYMICKASDAYFKKHSVKAVFISHVAYIQYAILVRVASKHNVPTLLFLGESGDKLEELRLIPMLTEREHPFPFLPYWKFPEQFQKFTPEEQEKNLSLGKEAIEKWVSGGHRSLGKKMVIHHIAKNLPWQISGNEQRALKPTLKPKILILLNCFFDGPLHFRYGLFPDFYQWITFILEHAGQTDFEWYMKPHPVALPANKQVIEKLLKKYPFVNLLDSSVTHRQLIAEGVKSVFVVHGTAIHEYAYFDIPVVAAGDSFQERYDFYLKPKTLDELKEMIKSADKLKVNVDKKQIYEFIYMNYLDYYAKNYPNLTSGNFLKFLKEDLKGDSHNPKVFEHVIKTDSSAKDEELRVFLQKFFKVNGRQDLLRP